MQWDEVLVHREQLAASLQSEAEGNALLSSEAAIAQVVRTDVAGLERDTGVRTDAAKLSQFNTRMLERARTATAISVAGAAEMNARMRTAAVDPPPLLVPPFETANFGRPAPLPLANFGTFSGAHSWMIVNPADVCHDSADAAAAAAACAAAASSAPFATAAPELKLRPPPYPEQG